MENAQTAQWHFRPEPFEGESFSHFLGRYCAANYITPNILAKHIEAGSVAIGRWRKLRYNPPLSERHLQRLADVTGVSQERLLAMLPQSRCRLGRFDCARLVMEKRLITRCTGSTSPLSFARSIT